MRTLLVVVFFFSALTLCGQEIKPALKCGERGQGLATDTYYHAVLERALRPRNWQTSLITISISASGSESKLILREENGSFELMRGTADSDIHKQLISLDTSCQLPSDPLDAAELVHVNWSKAELSADNFRQIHDEFASALSQVAAKMQARYINLLATHTAYLNLHTAQYSIVYDNKFEHVQVVADDVTGNPAEIDPTIRWVHSVLLLSEKSFQNR